MRVLCRSARDGLFDRANELAAYWEDAAHSLKGARHVIDIRAIGLVAGIELEPRPGAPTARAMELFHACFDNGLLVRATGDIIALSPPLIVEKPQIDERSEEHTSELQSIMRISYAVFCLNKKT